ncbi:unnamed protein product [Somion occarium]|uniref:Uncharacterized protein n=1 Tax=Somion occarium TaxID=3059160 RepID=A0ABP1E680_9APHY
MTLRTYLGRDKKRKSSSPDDTQTLPSSSNKVRFTTPPSHINPELSSHLSEDEAGPSSHAHRKFPLDEDSARRRTTRSQTRRYRNLSLDSKAAEDNSELSEVSATDLEDDKHQAIIALLSNAKAEPIVSKPRWRIRKVPTKRNGKRNGTSVEPVASPPVMTPDPLAFIQDFHGNFPKSNLCADDPTPPTVTQLRAHAMRDVHGALRHIEVAPPADTRPESYIRRRRKQRDIVVSSDTLQTITPQWMIPPTRHSVATADLPVPAGATLKTAKHGESTAHSLPLSSSSDMPNLGHADLEHDTTPSNTALGKGKEIARVAHASSSANSAEPSRIIPPKKSYPTSSVAQRQQNVPSDPVVLSKQFHTSKTASASVLGRKEVGQPSTSQRRGQDQRSMASVEVRREVDYSELRLTDYPEDPLSLAPAHLGGHYLEWENDHMRRNLDSPYSASSETRLLDLLSSPRMNGRDIVDFHMPSRIAELLPSEVLADDCLRRLRECEERLRAEGWTRKANHEVEMTRLRTDIDAFQKKQSADFRELRGEVRDVKKAVTTKRKKDKVMKDGISHLRAEVTQLGWEVERMKTRLGEAATHAMRPGQSAEKVVKRMDRTMSLQGTKTSSTKTSALAAAGRSSIVTSIRAGMVDAASHSKLGPPEASVSAGVRSSPMSQNNGTRTTSKTSGWVPRTYGRHNAISQTLTLVEAPSTSSWTPESRINHNRARTSTRGPN